MYIYGQTSPCYDTQLSYIRFEDLGKYYSLYKGNMRFSVFMGAHIFCEKKTAVYILSKYEIVVSLDIDRTIIFTRNKCVECYVFELN